MKGFLSEELLLKWLREFWDRRSGTFLEKRRMLLLNAFKGHVMSNDHTMKHDFSVAGS